MNLFIFDRTSYRDQNYCTNAIIIHLATIFMVLYGRQTVLNSTGSQVSEAQMVEIWSLELSKGKFNYIILFFLFTKCFTIKIGLIKYINVKLNAIWGFCHLNRIKCNLFNLLELFFFPHRRAGLVNLDLFLSLLGNRIDCYSAFMFSYCTTLSHLVLWQHTSHIDTLSSSFIFWPLYRIIITYYKILCE